MRQPLNTMYTDNKTYHLIGLPTLLVDDTTLHAP